MSTRWFFASARSGVGASASGASLSTSVTFHRVVAGRDPEKVDAPGPSLALVGPGHVLGFEPSLIIREEPSPATPAPENVMACVDLAHADLPWLLSQEATPNGTDPRPLPWIVLVVLREDEAADPRQARPLPVLTAPVAALPPLRERWAWAHVEARLDDGVTDPETARQRALDGVRSPTAGVVGRLLCPRKLAPDSGYLAAVVPATAAGVATGLDRELTRPPQEDAWPGTGPTVELPVYHWWRFRTGPAGTFEGLARRLRYRKATDLELGSRTVDVSLPWPGEPGPEPPSPVTVKLDGALRVPGPEAPEAWSDPAAQDRFRALLRERLDAPAQRREPDAPEENLAVTAVGPPLYGSHHTGQQTVPDDPESWLTALNLEVRRRVAAALGTRYVQLEQEFLMARAWEQAGDIQRANRLLAVTELAAVTAERSLRRHLDPLPVGDLVTMMAPVARRLLVSIADPGLVATGPVPLATALEKSAVPTGTATTAFARLTRPGGALARRAVRGTDGPVPDVPSVIEQGLVQSSMLAPENGEGAGLRDELRSAVDPLPLQLRRLADRIDVLADRTPDDPRPLRPIMAHPTFSVPIAEELLARWPEWALPGIGGLPPDTVTLLETNPDFVAALLVGLNHEFNQELLWREFPTDQRGTPFARFWPTDGADVDEIARWPLDAPLGTQVRGGDEGSLAMLVRGELLRRFPGTVLLAVQGSNGRLPREFAGLAGTPLPLDESTVLFLFSGITEQRARDEDWFFVFREPMRGTQFGFDDGAAGSMRSWADLTWSHVRVDGGTVRLQPAPPTPQPSPGPPPDPDPPDPDPAVWGRDAADMGRIAFQQPFQLAFRAVDLLRP
ncbi:MAG: hypothetical protein ABWY29_11335 [Blastococcus sp.]